MKLAAKNLAIGAGAQALIGSMNLEMETGRSLVILGPNGSGKSTLMRTLARQLKPISGLVTLDDSDVWTLPSGEFARHVAYVSQSQVFPSHLTIFEYTHLGRNPHQIWWQWEQSDNDRSAVQKALEATSLWDLKDRRLGSLSGGERQRASIAIALAQEPKFLLLDEPTAHLDFCHQQDLLHLLVRLKEADKISIVIVLHDLTAAQRLADDVLLLRKSSAASEVAHYGKVDDVLRLDTLEAVFGIPFAQVQDESGNKYLVCRDS